MVISIESFLVDLDKFQLPSHYYPSKYKN